MAIPGPNGPRRSPRPHTERRTDPVEALSTTARRRATAYAPAPWLYRVPRHSPSRQADQGKPRSASRFPRPARTASVQRGLRPGFEPTVVTAPPSLRPARRCRLFRHRRRGDPRVHRDDVELGRACSRSHDRAHASASAPPARPLTRRTLRTRPTPPYVSPPPVDYPVPPPTSLLLPTPSGPPISPRFRRRPPSVSLLLHGTLVMAGGGSGLSRPGFDGGLEARMMSWREEILASYGPTEEVPR
jgi:hypothetical protein